MRSWFESLEQRERLVLSVGAVLVSLIILWALVWSPLRSGASELDNAVADKQQLLATLQRAQALGGAAGPGPGSSSMQAIPGASRRSNAPGARPEPVPCNATSRTARMGFE